MRIYTPGSHQPNLREDGHDLETMSAMKGSMRLHLENEGHKLGGHSPANKGSATSHELDMPEDLSSTLIFLLLYERRGNQG